MYNKGVDKVILHCDLNNFYASVEQLSHPEFDGLPIAVSGNPEVRHGIVLAKNMLAKNAGVTTGEPLWSARRKCPDIVFLPPHFEDYVRISKEVFAIYTEFTDRVESFGLDECWLDVTASVRLLGDGKTIADKIRETVKARTGLTISVGVSFTKVLAKLGSDLKKPDATVVLSRENYMDVIGNMPPSVLIMIGSRTAAKLRDLGITTVRRLAEADRNLLRSRFGIIADKMSDAARGVENGEVSLYYSTRIPKSVSHGTTTPRDMTSEDDARTVIYALSELVAMRLRRYNMTASGISLSLRRADLSGMSRQCVLPRSTSNATDIAEGAMKLLSEMHTFPAPLRALSVGATRLSQSGAEQLSLFDDEYAGREEKLEKCVDSIRGKYGYKAMKRGVVMDGDIVLNLHEEDDFLPFKR